MAFRWFLLCLNMLAFSAFSQNGTIEGKLRFEDQTPTPFATVSIRDTDFHTMAEEDGSFKFTNVPSGDYTLDISSIEAEKHSLDISLRRNLLSLSITLQRASAQELKEVEVNGKTIATEIKEVGYAVSVIETQQAALRNAQTNDLLDRTVGVRVRQNGGLGSSVDYNLNGMSGNSVRIFIDGIPMSAYGPSFSLNSIPPALIERIEVYKGVIPAHLADDALGGAINVVLKNKMRNNLTGSVSYGSFNTFQANVSSLYRHDKSGFTVRLSGFHNYSDNDYEVWGHWVRNIAPNGRYEHVRVKRFHNAYKSTGAQLALGFTDVKWADEFFVGYNTSDDYNEIQHGVYMSIPYEGRFLESQANVTNLSYRKDNLFTRGLELTFNGLYSKRSSVINDTVKWNYNWSGEKSLDLNGLPFLTPYGAQQEAATINHIDRNIVTFRAGLNYEISPNHKIVFNHSFNTTYRTEQDEMKSIIEREFIDSRSLLKNVSSLAYELKAIDNRLTSHVFGKYYNQQIEKTDPQLVRVGDEYVRTDVHTSNVKERTGYGMAFSFDIVRHWLILASAEKAVRMPSENEIFGSPGENIQENFGINAEVSYNLNFGIRKSLFELKDHKLAISSTGFIRDSRDKITRRIARRNNDAIQQSPFENQQKVKAKGFEAEVNYSFRKNLSVMLNTSRFDLVYNTRTDANGVQFSYYNKQLPNEPFFTINGMVQYTFHHLIGKNSMTNVYSNFGFVEGFYVAWMQTEDARTPRQYALDLGVGYTLPNKKFTVSGDIKNVLNKQVFDNYAVQKPGRAFYLKLNYTINNL